MTTEADSGNTGGTTCTSVTKLPPLEAELFKLRGELDRLRREVQDLSKQVDDWQDIRYRLKQKWSRWKKRFASAPRKVKRRMDKLRHPFPRPYDLRVLQPSRAHRPRVLHVVGNFHIGGSARLIVDLIEHLGNLYEHRVVARDLPNPPAYRGISLQNGRAFNSPRQALQLLRSFAPDIVHVHYVAYRNHDYSLADRRWYRRVFEALEEYECRVIENVNIPVEPFYSPKVDCYVHVSDYVRSTFGFRDVRNLTIHPGSDLRLFCRREHSPIPDDHIGMVYRLDGDKLNEQAIEVFIAVVRERPHTRVSVVGGGAFLDPYRAAVRRAGLQEAFAFPGYVPYDTLPDWLERMSLFVAPVHRESFGQVSPFAMGMKLPVVGYDVGALQEITAAPELLAPPGDVEALTSIIIELLEDRERRLRIGHKNRRRAEAIFSIDAMIKAYSRLYEELVAVPRSQAGQAIMGSLSL